MKKTFIDPSVGEFANDDAHVFICKFKFCLERIKDFVNACHASIKKQN